MSGAPAFVDLISLNKAKKKEKSSENFFWNVSLVCRERSWDWPIMGKKICLEQSSLRYLHLEDNDLGEQKEMHWTNEKMLSVPPVKKIGGDLVITILQNKTRVWRKKTLYLYIYVVLHQLLLVKTLNSFLNFGFSFKVFFFLIVFIFLFTNKQVSKQFKI